MTLLTRSRLPVRLIVLAALVLSFVLSLGSVSAATPTVMTNPSLVPFDPTPGKPGTTTLTFAANGTTGLTACGQDNGTVPTLRLGPVDPSTPLVIPFPFIQAGKYTFWVSTDNTCAGTKLIVGGVPVQATATRLGPNGVAGQDDIQLTIDGDQGITFDQAFPLPLAKVCIMSGDGAQVDVAFTFGQDARPIGMGTSAVTTTVTPYSGQNGCYDTPWQINGGYRAAIVRSGVSDDQGFCGAGVNSVPLADLPAPIGRCAQVVFSRDPNNSPFPNGTVLLGAIVTGVDAHAVQVCVSAFSPGAGGTPVQQLGNTVNAYNQTGAVNLTRLTLEFPSKTVVKVTTYDITAPGKPGGIGGLQFICPTATATQSGSAITAISVPAVPNATIIDTKTYFIL